MKGRGGVETLEDGLMLPQDVQHLTQIRGKAPVTLGCPFGAHLKHASI